MFRGEPYPVPPPQRSGSVSSSTGTWPVALETPLCASGTSARRRRISRVRVGVQLPFSESQWWVGDSLRALMREEAGAGSNSFTPVYALPVLGRDRPREPSQPLVNQQTRRKRERGVVGRD